MNRKGFLSISKIRFIKVRVQSPIIDIESARKSFVAPSNDKNAKGDIRVKRAGGFHIITGNLVMVGAIFWITSRLLGS